MRVSRSFGTAEPHTVPRNAAKYQQGPRKNGTLLKKTRA